MGRLSLSWHTRHHDIRWQRDGVPLRVGLALCAPRGQWLRRSGLVLCRSPSVTMRRTSLGKSRVRAQAGASAQADDVPPPAQLPEPGYYHIPAEIAVTAVCMRWGAGHACMDVSIVCRGGVYASGIVKLTQKIARACNKERTIEGLGLSRAPVFSLFSPPQLSSRGRRLGAVFH